ncbi:MAG: tyrosine-type recombinase/integrase [Clostridiaceae bacterium]
MSSKNKANGASNSFWWRIINNHNLVCTRDTGAPLNTSSFSHAFGDFIKKLEIPHIRFHDLRHTNATLMLLAGTPAKVASSRLGHSTINITMDLYSHVLKDMNVEAAEKLNEVIYK